MVKKGTKEGVQLESQAHYSANMHDVQSYMQDRQAAKRKPERGNIRGFNGGVQDPYRASL